MINFDDFAKLDLRVGKILEVTPHPNAEKLYIFNVDIGEKVIQLVAGMKPFYTIEELLGKRIVVLVNLEPKNIRGTASQGMILAGQGKDDVSLLVLDKALEPGSKIK